MKKSKNIVQFKAILKKDLALLFRKKVAIFIFGGPFVLMFIMLILPTLFSGSQAMTLIIYNEDNGYASQNIGNAITSNISVYYSSNSETEVNIQEVNNLTAVLETEDLGLYIPGNFSFLAFTSTPKLYTVDTQNTFLTESQLTIIQNIAKNVMTTIIANRTIPQIGNVELQPSASEGEVVLGKKASIIAYPLGYMIFLLIALNSSSNSLIGFAREKRMRTMEILLSYTYNHRFLVISKAITGVVASLGSTLSYLGGILTSSLVLSSSQNMGLFDIFALSFDVISVLDMFLIFIAVVTALVLSTLMTMAVDCNISREASERLSPLVSIGFSFFFYFIIITNPFAISSSLIINPFYWPYRLTLLVVSKKFNYEIILYLGLIVGLGSILIRLATRGIQKEKNLYLD